MLAGVIGPERILGISDCGFRIADWPVAHAGADSDAAGEVEGFAPSGPASFFCGRGTKDPEFAKLGEALPSDVGCEAEDDLESSDFWQADCDWIR